jgi:hypothetical protein
MDWIDLAQDVDQWRALVNTVLKTLGSIKCWEVVEWLQNWLGFIGWCLIKHRDNFNSQYAILTILLLTSPL